MQGGGVSQNCGSVFSLWAAKALRSSETRTHPRPRHWIRGSRCWRRPARRGQLAPSCSKTAWSAQHADRLARCFLGAGLSCKFAKGKVEIKKGGVENFYISFKKIGFLDQPEGCHNSRCTRRPSKGPLPSPTRIRDRPGEGGGVLAESHWSGQLETKGGVLPSKQVTKARD